MVFRKSRIICATTSESHQSSETHSLGIYNYNTENVDTLKSKQDITLLKVESGKDRAKWPSDGSFSGHQGHGRWESRPKPRN